MNISLRKASALQNSINDAIKSISLTTDITVNEFQSPEAELAFARETFKTNLARRDALFTALYAIRKEVSSANHTAGVDQRLADIAHLDKQIQNYTALAGKEVETSMTVITGKLDKIRNRKEDSRSIYGNPDTVSTSVLTEADLKAFKANLSQQKKAKQKLQDEVLELNVRTEIALSNEVVATLNSEGLL